MGVKIFSIEHRPKRGLHQSREIPPRTFQAEENLQGGQELCDIDTLYVYSCQIGSFPFKGGKPLDHASMRSLHYLGEGFVK